MKSIRHYNMLIMAFVICLVFTGCKKEILHWTPRIDGYVVIDILNESNKGIDNASLIIRNSNYQNLDNQIELFLPLLESGNRKIISIKSESIPYPTSHIYIKQNDANKVIIKEVRKGIGASGLANLSTNGGDGIIVSAIDTSYDTSINDHKNYHQKYSAIYRFDDAKSNEFETFSSYDIKDGWIN